MKKGKKAGQARFAPVVQSVLTCAVTYILLTAMLLIGATPEQHDIQVGVPSAIDILASKDVNDTVTTEANRESAAAAVEPSYKSVDSKVVVAVAADMEDAFARLTALRDEPAGGTAEISDAALTMLNAKLPVEITAEQYAALMNADADNLRDLFAAATASVRDTLNTTLPEGQENTAVSRISRALGAQGYADDLVSVATVVIRKCLRPNMLIDEEITEANRQKARDAVETVTCVKGEVIVRRGEIVTPAQYAMLSSLGLLKEDSLDINLLGGIALIVLLVMGCLALYMLRYHREKLQPKPLMLLALIAVLVTGINLAISRFNPYMMPVALGAMLVSLLLDKRLALYVNLGLAFIASLMTDAGSGLFTVAILPILLMGMVSGPVILTVFSRRTQRITTLVAGVFVGVSNFLCTLAIGLINSAEMYTVLTNALWAMAGGIIGAILCIGIQPLMEAMFNLATNSKLIELSNPNQPLLRRLLLEAPGTYHHSIIVANLAEAATAAVGGNDLLARVGAYYHDIGKLKRPIYFKENQMGDNPHDRTDPRVSAAIVTAHPRDGAAMAQKARIPEPVLDIIRQHHGDSVPLWFYDKAVKQYGAENVDINAFRYEGPRPRTKEAACVMLADTIEAAARSIPDPTPEKIDALIRKLVHNTLNGGQLDESPLTFRDLETICSAFSTVLTGVFHERIEYPDIPIPPRVDRAEAADEPAQEAPAARPEAAKPAHAPSPDNSASVKPDAQETAGSAEAAQEAPKSAPAPVRRAPEMRIAVEPIMPPLDQKPADGEDSADAATAEANRPEPVRRAPEMRIAVEPIMPPLDQKPAGDGTADDAQQPKEAGSDAH